MVSWRGAHSILQHETNTSLSSLDETSFSVCAVQHCVKVPAQVWSSTASFSRVHAAWAKARKLSASSSTLYPIHIRGQVKKIKVSQKLSHTFLYIPPAKGVTTHGLLHQDWWAEGAKDHQSSIFFSKTCSTRRYWEGYQKPCRKHFCVICSQRNLALYHFRPPFKKSQTKTKKLIWLCFFLLKYFFPVPLDILISYINTLSISSL